jgi:hypothetical protein
MDILIKTATSNEVQRWGSPPGKVSIPETGDVVFPGDSPRPIDIGPDHYLATATIVDEDVGDDQKRGPETVGVVGQVVTVTRTTVDKDDDDLMAEWEGEMAVATRDMPDCVEAVINSMDEAQLGRLDQAAKDYLAAKKTVKEARPEVPGS